MLIAGMENDFEREFMENINRSYYKEMKRKAFRIVENESDAEEIVQESFIKLIRKGDTLMSIE